MERSGKLDVRFHLQLYILNLTLKVKLAVIEKVHEKGQDNVVIEDLVQDVAPKAASLVSVINQS